MNDDIWMVLVLIGAFLAGFFLAGFFLNPWLKRIKQKAHDFEKYLAKVDAYLESTPLPDGWVPSDLQEIKISILETHMYEGFDGAADATWEMVQTHPELEALINIAEEELIAADLFNRFEEAAHTLVENMVKEENYEDNK